MFASLLLVLPVWTPVSAPDPAPSALISIPGSIHGSSAPVDQVVIKTQDKVELKGDYYPPRSTSKRAPAVLLVHDAGGNRQQFTDIAEGLRKKGFGVLAIDLRGHGASATEDLDWSKMTPEEHTKLWSFTTRDLAAAAEWIGDRKELHATNLNLVGLRGGCTLVVKHAGRDENVRSLVLLDPPQEQLGYDMEGDIQEIAGLPTYVVIPRARRAYAEAIVEVANSEAGVVFVEPKLLSSKIESILDDKGLPSDVANWISSKAEPKKGR